MGLSQYQKKRDFSKTAEPKGKINKSSSRLFIIQKHAASHLHYDFRLALEGVLKSWAIPKGPCLDPKVKRLAMQVEDHPIEYGLFEGIIPKGQYGGGTVMLWDKGVWEPLDTDPKVAYQKGHLRFTIHAEKLQGRWDLIRFKDDKHWFLIKYQDANAKSLEQYDITKMLQKSILSNSSMEEIAKNDTHIWRGSDTKKVTRKRPKITKANPVILPEGLTRSRFPEFIPPQLATLVDKPPKGSQWAHEIKFDGYRILAFKNYGETHLKSRNNKDWTLNLSPIAAAVNQLPFDQLILDGEVVVLDEEGRSDFQLLQNTIKYQTKIQHQNNNQKNNNKNTNKKLHYFLFDLLYFNGYDLRHLPLIERKAILKKLLSTNIPYLLYSDHIIKEGDALFDYSCAFALEGIISKHLDGAYYSGRSSDWLKIKCLNRQEFVIGGYTSPKKGRPLFGSLFLGVYREGILRYVGNVGTGFTETSLKEIYQLLTKYPSKTNPFNTKPPGSCQAHWINPKLVCEVEFTEWTQDGHLRHPSFKGLRLDKTALEIVKEVETPVTAIKREASRNSQKKSIKTPTKNTKKVSKNKKLPFDISNQNKVLYPEDNITKRALLNYFEKVADYILPYLQLRPLTLVRCPSHYQHCFYQRHYNQTTPNALHPIEDPQDDSHHKYIYLNDREGLFSLVQMGVLEIHPWGSQVTQLETPDIIIFDLDPAPDVPWTKVVTAALDVKEHLEKYQLQSFVKSTGGKGLHVVVPIQPEYQWEEVKTFTRIFVQFLEQLKPNDYISKMTKSRRKGKIFIDYLRNQRTATAISPYSPRARLHAPVSVPLRWNELKKFKKNYTIKTLPKRLKMLKEDPWNEFWKIKQSLRLNML